ncbi:MAG: hypothetical protein M3498_17360 [Deinococcota bacterium]|nr:hypothetical protein [Deinococcota bacterium]
MNPIAQHIYVVRIWREPTADGLGSWRASVSDSQNREKRFFASPRALAAFLGLEADAPEDAPQDPS